MTPRARSSAVSDARRTSTPRGLNEPVFWNSSSLSQVSAPQRSESDDERQSGVRCSPRRAMRRRAASSSSSVGSAIAASYRPSDAARRRSAGAPRG